MKRREIDNDALYNLFLDLEFTAFIRQFKLEAPKAPARPKAVPAGAIPDLLDLSGGVSTADNGADDAPDSTPVSAEEAISKLGDRFAVELSEDGLALSNGTENLFVKTDDVSRLAPLFAEIGRAHV